MTDFARLKRYYEVRTDSLYDWNRWAESITEAWPGILAEMERPEDEFVGDEVTLAQASPGLFMFNDHLGLKTEYMTDAGHIEVFVAASGEAFWGGKLVFEERDVLIVREVDEDALLRRYARRGVAEGDGESRLKSFAPTPKAQFNPADAGFTLATDEATERELEEIRAERHRPRQGVAAAFESAAKTALKSAAKAGETFGPPDAGYFRDEPDQAQRASAGESVGGMDVPSATQVTSLSASGTSPDQPDAPASLKLETTAEERSMWMKMTGRKAAAGPPASWVRKLLRDILCLLAERTVSAERMREQCLEAVKHIRKLTVKSDTALQTIDALIAAIRELPIEEPKR